MMTPYTIGTKENADEINFPRPVCSSGLQPQYALRGRLTNWGLGLDLADRSDHVADTPSHRGMFIGPNCTFRIDDGEFDPVGNKLTSVQAHFCALAVGWEVSGPGVLPETIIAAVDESANCAYLSRPVDNASFRHELEFSCPGLSIEDTVYLNKHGFKATSIGLGFPQPPVGTRVNVLNDPRFPGDTTLRVSTLKNQTGVAFSVGLVRSERDNFQVLASGEVRASGYRASDGTRGMTGQVPGNATLIVKDGLIVGFTPAKG